MADKNMTTGEASLKLQRNPEVTNVVDQTEANLKDYRKNLIECVDKNKKDFNSDFFVVVITKKEKLMQNVIRNYFFARRACPTPDYDQAVYSYNHNDESLQLVWVLPSKDACIYLQNNKNFAPKEEHELLNYVLSFASGELYRRAKDLNKEESKSNLLKKEIKVAI